MNINILKLIICVWTSTTLLSSAIRAVQECEAINGTKIEFIEQNETFIIDCLKALDRHIDFISIEGGNIRTVTKLTKVLGKFDSLKYLSITNSPLENANFGYSMPHGIIYVNLSGNKINQFTIKNTMDMVSLNLSHNNLSTITIQTTASYDLLELDLSHNPISTLSISPYMLRKFNLSASIDHARSIQFNGIHLIDLIDLSSNKLENLTFLNSMIKYKNISLRNNSFTSFDVLNRFDPGSFIWFSENPLRCENFLMKSWLNLVSKNITFDDETTCSFDDSPNKYPLNKYGSLVSSETGFLNVARDWALLKAYSYFNAMEIWATASMDRLTIDWTSTGQTFECMMRMKSENGSELLSTNVTFDSSNKSMEIFYESMHLVKGMCIFIWVNNQTHEGSNQIIVPVFCQNLKKSYIREKKINNLSTWMIILETIFGLYFLFSIIAIGYFYKSLWRRSARVKDQNIELQMCTNPKTSEPPKETQPNQYQPSYMTSSHSLPSEYKEYSQGAYQLNPTRVNNFYMAMGSSEPYAVVGNDIYDCSVYESKNSINKKEVEEIYD